MIGTVAAPHSWEHWPRARALLERACSDARIEDVDEALSDYAKAQLWTGGEAELVGVTQLYPGECFIWLLAGDFRKWGKPMLAVLEQWARGEGCGHIEFNGRRGWLARLPDWSVVKMNGAGVTMRKAL